MLEIQHAKTPRHFLTGGKCTPEAFADVLQESFAPHFSLEEESFFKPNESKFVLCFF